jgi:hypothetical protein
MASPVRRVHARENELLSEAENFIKQLSYIAPSLAAQTIIITFFGGVKVRQQQHVDV